MKRKRDFTGGKRVFSSVSLQEYQMEEILKEDLGLEKVRKHIGRKGTNFMFCC
jgi:hypothetical protein